MIRNPIIIRQFEQISSGGYLVLLRKLKKLVFLLPRTPLYFLAILFVFMMRLISPIAVVRLGMLDIGRIGGIIYGDWYLSQKADGLHLGRYLDFFYFVKSTKHVNKQWIKMWKRVLRVVPFGELVSYVDRSNKLVPGYSSHVIPLQKSWPIKDEAVKCILKCRMPNISFTPEEETLGLRALSYNFETIKGNAVKPIIAPKIRTIIAKNISLRSLLTKE